MKVGKKIILGVVLGTASVAVLTASLTAFAYQGDPNQKGPNYTPQRHEQMLKAFENNDYQAWKSLMNGRGRVSQVINESNFARFAEMHRLMQEGKIEEANKIRQELGLGGGRMNGTPGQGNRAGGCGNCPTQGQGRGMMNQ